MIIIIIMVTGMSVDDWSVFESHFLVFNTTNTDENLDDSMLDESTLDDSALDNSALNDYGK